LDFIQKAAYARGLGVSPSTVYRACHKGRPLEAALSPDGRRIDREHAAARAYASRMHGVRPGRRPDKSAGERARLMLEQGRQAFRGEADAPGGDVAPSSGADANKIAQALADIRLAGEGRLPQDLEDLGTLTLREVVESCGDLPGLRDAVKSLKEYAQMRNQEGIAAKRRSELIDRKLIPSVFVPIVNTAFRRLVEEVPDAITDQVVARVQSGGDSLRLDVVDIYRREVSTILTACVSSMAEQIRERAQ